MGVLHMPTAAGHHPLKSCPRHEAPPQIILKSVTFTMTTGSPPRAPPLEVTSSRIWYASSKRPRGPRVPILRLVWSLGVTRKCSRAAGVTSYALFTPTNSTVHTTHQAINYIGAWARHRSPRALT